MMEITLDRYTELVVKEAKLRDVMEALYQDVGLSYGKDRLSIDTISVEVYLRVADSDRYWRVYELLKEQANGHDKD